MSDIDFILLDADERMQGAIKSLESDLATFRTGRAAPQLLDRIMVEVYGTEVLLKQVALVSVPEPQQLAVRPFDANTLGAIERAILKSDLSLTPNNDGKIIRLNIPRLTEERRRQLSKLMAKRAEEGRVAVRNVRRDAQNHLRGLKNNKEITEDDLFKSQEDLQEITDAFIKQIDEIGKAKEEEIMEV